MELIILLVIIGLGVYGWHKFNTTVGARIAARQRDKQIETAIRLGMRDAEATDRIARRIIEEERGA